MRSPSLIGCLLLGLAQAATAAPAEDEIEELLNLDLYELASVRIVASSKTEEAWFITPSAISVLTRNQIEQSGAENLGDLLAQLPGVGVYQLSRDRLAVGIRNDGRLFFNALLLLVDGQPLYHPALEGPWWEGIPVALQDIERIEVIRGTGSSAWGANSSSGVVNIVTRPPDGDSTPRLQLSAGSQHSVDAYAATAGGSPTPWRASVAGRRHDSAADHYDTAQASVQAQTPLGGFDTRFSLRGHQFHAPDGNAQGNATGTAESLGLAGYVDARRRVDRKETRLYATLNHSDEYYFRQDADFRYYSSLIELSQQDQWGSTHRYLVSASAQDTHIAANDNGSVSTFHPDKSRLHSLTAAGTLFLNPADLWLSQLGLRAEQHNILDRILWSPSLHIGWQPRSQLFLWAAYDRGYQLPNLVQRNGLIPLGQRPIAPGVLVPVVATPGGPDLPAQPVTQYQLGLRALLPSHLLELTVFEQQRERQISIDPTTARFNASAGRLELSQRPFLASRIQGIELAWQGRFRALEAEANYSWLDKHSHPSRSGNYPALNPQYSFQHKLHLGLTWHHQRQTYANAGLTWYDDYMSEGLVFVPNPRIRAHARLDITLSHELNPRLRCFLAAKNLLNDDIEWDYPFSKNPPEEVEPSVRLGVEFTPSR